MKIVFYSSNSNKWETYSLRITNYPSWTEQWSSYCENHTENEYIFITQKPALFMPQKENKGFKLIVLEPEANAEKFIQIIKEQKPDLAIALTYWITPYDWLPVKDSIIGEALQAEGIKTICHPLETSINCFDKWRTHQELEKLGFNIAKGVYVHHDMYFCAGSTLDVLENVYKESVAAQIKKLKLPLIIKDTLGLSSYGMTVVHTYGEAIGYLNSKRNNSDRIVEEYIQGTQFGTEIHGSDGNYKICPPFTFSVNQYGITSPKQSIKLGPVTDQSLNLENLNADLNRLAQALHLSGVAQVDLIYSNNKWYIIEINPRLSGMTETYNVMYQTTLPEFLLIASGIEKLPEIEQNIVLNIKLPILSDVYLEKLSELPYIKYLCQTENKLAKQERERGYCEVIICAENQKRLEANLLDLKEKFPEIIEPAFFETALQLVRC